MAVRPGDINGYILGIRLLWRQRKRLPVIYMAWQAFFYLFAYRKNRREIRYANVFFFC